MDTNPFSLAKAARTITWLAIAATIPIVTLTQAATQDALAAADITLPASIVTALATAKVALGYLRKCIPPRNRTGLLSLLNLFAVPLAFAIALGG